VRSLRFEIARLAILTIIAATVVLGAAAQDASTVLVNGRRMHVQTAGTPRARGEPVVVFESGAGMGLGAWSTVLGEVGRFARAVAYDRAGIGLSESDSRPPTPRQVAETCSLGDRASEMRKDPRGCVGDEQPPE
jgi:hypothetical protein